MSLDFFVVIAAFVFPGAVALKTWDFVVLGQGERPLWNLAGYGTILSVALHALCQSLGWIDLRLVLHAGRVYTPALVQPANAGYYVAGTLSLATAAAILGRVSTSVWGRRWSSKIFGRTPTAPWTEAMQSSLERWVHVRTRSERDWRARLILAPEHQRDGALVLSHVSGWDDEHNTWVEYSPRYLLVLFARDIEFMKIEALSAEVADDSPGQEDVLVSNQPDESQ